MERDNANAKAIPPRTAEQKEAARRAVETILKGATTLGGLKIKDLIDEGRRS